MSGDLESKDKKEARTLIIAFAVIGLLAVIAAVFAVPIVTDFYQHYLAPGMGMKDAAVASFIVTVIVLVVFAVAAGDGLIGELQYMLSGFFGFFFILWLLIAWIF